MKAPRELDALVAEKVMGWEKYYSVDGAGGKFFAYWIAPHSPMVHPDFHPHYSTDIAAAWEAVERLRARGDWEIGVATGRSADRVWEARFMPWAVSEPDGKGEADTAPMAICLAALRAVWIEP